VEDMRFYNLTILTIFYGWCTTVAPGLHLKSDVHKEGKATSCPVELRAKIFNKINQEV